MTTSPTAAELTDSLGRWVDPYTGAAWADAKTVAEVVVDPDTHTAQIRLKVGYPIARIRDALAADLSRALCAAHGLARVDVSLDSTIVAHAVQKALKPLPGVKNIVAVASGKGGVGKSTVAANLALALSAEGARVGILDADIYGPSQPRMLGVSGQPESIDGKTMLPNIAFGVKVNSIGFLIEEDTPMIWRGPMVTSALQHLVNNTQWGELDYLIVDLPPGTGDTQLTLAQQVPLAGALIVTTPQDIALLDAQKGLAMFEKVSVPVLGLVENMSVHICSHCGHTEHVFGEGGGERMARKYGVDLLGSLPLDLSIRENADNGHPSVVADPDGPIAQMYFELARKLAGRLALRPKDHSGRLGGIGVVTS